MSASEIPPQSSSQAAVVREVDPLLKDLSEKKQSFRRNVVSLAAELKEVRGRLASEEQSFAKETLSRHEAETKAMNLETERERLQKTLEERNLQLQASTSAAEMYVKELDDLRLQLSATKATADASAVSAQSAHLQCLALVEELEEKNCSLNGHESLVSKLGEQLDLLQSNLRARDFSQMQLKDEVSRVELEIMQALAMNGASKDHKVRKILDEFSPKDFEKIDKLLSLKDDEISKLRDEIRIMSAHWKLKTKELESQFRPCSTFGCSHTQFESSLHINGPYLVYLSAGDAPQSRSRVEEESSQVRILSPRSTGSNSQAPKNGRAKG